MNWGYLIDDGLGMARVASNGVALLDYAKNAVEELYQQSISKSRPILHLLATASSGVVSNQSMDELHFLFQLRGVKPSVSGSLPEAALATISAMFESQPPAASMPPGFIDPEDSRTNYLFLFLDGSDQQALQKLALALRSKEVLGRRDFNFYPVIVCPMSQGECVRYSQQKFLTLLQARPAFKAISELTDLSFGHTLTLESYDKVLRFSSVLEFAKPRCNLKLKAEPLPRIPGLPFSESGASPSAATYNISFLLRGTPSKRLLYSKFIKGKQAPELSIDVSKCYFVSLRVLEQSQPFEVELTPGLRQLAAECRLNVTLLPVSSSGVVMALLCLQKQQFQQIKAWLILCTPFPREDVKPKVTLDENVIEICSSQSIQSIFNLGWEASRLASASLKLHRKRRSKCCSAFSSAKKPEKTVAEHARAALILRESFFDWDDSLRIGKQKDCEPANILMDNIRALLTEEVMANINQRSSKTAAEVPDSIEEEEYNVELTRLMEEVEDSVVPAKMKRKEPPPGKVLVKCSLKHSAPVRAETNRLKLLA